MAASAENGEIGLLCVDLNNIQENLKSLKKVVRQYSNEGASDNLADIGSLTRTIKDLKSNAKLIPEDISCELGQKSACEIHVPKKTSKRKNVQLEERDKKESQKIKENLENFLNTTLRGKLREELCERGHVKFESRFRPIGSSSSQTDVGVSADFDYIYEVKRELIVETVKENQTCKIYDSAISSKKEHKEIKPSEEYKLFSENVVKVLKRYENQRIGSKANKLKFGGFAHNEFSGVRHCEPAVTALFKWEGKTTYDIPVDITLGYLLPPCNVHEEVKKKLLEYPIEGDLDVNSNIHLVPVIPESGKWHITTAVLETLLLPNIPEYLKAAIRICKRFKSFLCADKCPIDEGINGVANELLSNIKKYREEKPRCPEKCSNISALMTEGHTILQKENVEGLSESCTKSAISLNSSAIKFVALQCLRDPEHPHKEKLLAGEILKTLLECKHVEHPFLDHDISPVSIATYAANVKAHLVPCCMNQLKEYITHISKDENK